MLLLIFPRTWICTSKELFLSGAESQGKSPTARRAWRRAIHQLFSFLRQHGNTASAMRSFTTKRSMLLPEGYLCRNEVANDSRIRASCGPNQRVAYVTNAQGGQSALPVSKGTTRCFFYPQKMWLRNSASGDSSSFVFISEGYRQEEETAQKI